jgi:peptide/nickel transport system permease protein
MLGTEYTESRAAALRTELGLDAPVITRYFKWLVGFVTGDLGISYSYKTPVSELLGDKIVVTALLSALAFLLVVVISIPVGLLLARFQGGIVDRVMVVVNQITMSIPPFFIGIIFTCIFGFFLKLFTPGDFISYKDSVSGFLGYIFFPALAIALPKSAMTVKLLRRSMIRETHEDYVRTAYSRGNSRATVLRSHVLRNAILPVITFLAMTLADIVAGSIIIEQVFTIPGVGRMLLLSISNRDYPVVQAIVVMIAFVVVFMNFLADIANQYIDPRIRLS